MLKDELINLIREHRARIGVIGLGYVGLPLAVEFAHKGFTVTGFEVDTSKAEQINDGTSYIGDVESGAVKEMVEAKRLRATTDFDSLRECDAIIICVPTPLRKTKEPDISYILASAGEITRNLRRGQLIILESTTYPGTTDEVLLPMFEEAGFHLDEDFLLAFSPERVDPGNPQFQTHNIPKVVGGCTDDSTEAAAELYGKIVTNVHAVTSARVAEAAKLLENTFRAVNIGMANEMARLCYALGIDTWEVIAAAATKPFGFMPFYPGPGIGGHCLVGNETVVVRAADGTNERVESLAEIFVEQSSDFTVRSFKASNGAELVRHPRLQALSIDMETQKPVWKPVQYLFKRPTDSRIVTITTSDNRKLTVTDLHPMLVSDKSGGLRQTYAKDLQAGDRLPVHCLTDLETNDATARHDNEWTLAPSNPEIDLLSLLPSAMIGKIRVRLRTGSWRQHRERLKAHIGAEKLWEFIRQDHLPLRTYLELEKDGRFALPHQLLRLHTGRGTSASSFPAVFRITPNIARLIGYYLAEGCVTREKGNYRARFSFNRDETEFINDVRSILETSLGIRSSTHDSKIDYVTHIRAASHLFGWSLHEALRCGDRSTEMRVPDALLSASPLHQRELLKGLLRGDGDVYVRTGIQSYRKNGKSYTARNASAEVGFFTSSPVLMQQVVYLLQCLGFTPTFKRRKPRLQMKGYEQLLRLRGWLGTKGEKLETYFAEVRRTVTSRTFKKIGNALTVPVKFVEIKKPVNPVEVYSMEVKDTNTFATSYGIFVHNCIPLDPHYLSWKARQHGFDSRFIGLAEEVNSRMPEHVVMLIADGLNDARKSLKGSRVLLLGVAYKKDVNDVRESPALAIIDRLRAKGADVRYHDPFVPEVNFDDAHTDSSGEPLQSVALTDDELRASDAVCIITDHSDIDYARVVELATLIVDTRNALNGKLRGSSQAQIIRL